MIVNTMLKSLKVFFATLFYRWENVNVVLIISTGRTGTEFVARLLNNLYGTDVLSVHEPAPDLLDISVRSKKENWSRRRLVWEMRKARAGYSKVCHQENRQFYVESNNNLSFLLPYLKDLFPRLKIVFFSRAPDTFLLSELNKKHGRKKFSLFGADDVRRRITPELIGDTESSSSWPEWTRVRKIIWYWAMCNDYVLQYIDRYDHLHLKYEDFFDPDKCYELLDAFIKFSGFPLASLSAADVQEQFQRRHNASRTRQYHGLSQLSPADMDFFFHRTQVTATRLGYPKSD